MKSMFKNWKVRSSQTGKITTNKVCATEKELAQIKLLKNEKDTGINANGNKVKWSENKSTKLSELIAKRDAPDVLPTGAITYLDEEFNRILWRRRRTLNNKYLDKGNIGEEDGLALITLIDDVYYSKNKKFFENDFTKGTPDCISDFLIDIKCSWDKESFDKAELSTLYMWQIKNYLWQAKKTKGKLIYTLINCPVHQVIEAIKSSWFKLGQPDNENEDWFEHRCQIERNMIFDIPKFQKDYPGYQFENPVLDFSIPPIARVKRFDVELFPEDIKVMKSRVLLGRKYLVEKERAILEQIENYENNLK